MTAKTPRARKSHEDRTGLSSRACKILIAAQFTRPATVEDDMGNVMRVWTKEEQLRWTFDELRSCLANRVAIEPNEMFGTVPQSALKYSVNKGWLLPNVSKTLYRITLKGVLLLKGT